MREFIIVHKADSAAGTLLRKTVEAHTIRTDKIELILERDIGIINPEELDKDTCNKFYIWTKATSIKGSTIYFKDYKGLQTLHVIESQDEIYQKMYPDEKAKKK